MSRFRLLPGLLLSGVIVALLFPVAAAAQPIADSLFSWRGYSRVSETHVSVYPSAPDEETRVHTVVLKELATNTGPSTVDDIRYLADLVGRQFGIDPVHAYWVVHWGAFSYAGASAQQKDLFLRVTFRRTESGRVSSPYWRVISRDDVREMTDRRWRGE
jgi:hypothetical protein